MKSIKDIGKLEDALNDMFELQHGMMDAGYGRLRFNNLYKDKHGVPTFSNDDVMQFLNQYEQRVLTYQRYLGINYKVNVK